MKKIIIFFLLLKSCLIVGQVNVARMNSTGQAYIGPLDLSDLTNTQNIRTTLFSQINTVTISGYTINTAYSLKGTIVGTDTVQAASFVSGKSWRDDVSGTYSTAPVTLGNITVQVLLGTNVILTKTFSGLPINISSLGYTGYVNFVCRSGGSSGSIYADGQITFNTTTALTPTSITLLLDGTLSSLLNLSTSQVFDIKISFSASSNVLNSGKQILSSLN